ncbi:dolichyl pyrophosphate Man9GlcNAc2 alpha-1,3-glucosyltransferase-like [Rhopilema esculentum]|uniref:dolichyl pyrophosphate Man9GlcNAc2 alpha-1,3-glucosyltransferase-like n=1 Tax=Rhopilema esculentum TaxID=499914 RepID=UPI0031E2B518
MSYFSYINHFVAIVGALFLRWTVSLNPYSGENKAPMYGDYEAQRHWMEITYNLPVKEWYVNSSKNDLLYWGLDYPPLTAYHSWFCGLISNYIDPAWVQLGVSRGFESYHHKLFMRYTVLTADVLIYMTAVLAFINSGLPKLTASKKNILLGLILAYPGLILIDHGHFQYNCISLGLCVWAVVLLVQKQAIAGAVFFSLALNYKQMELYHAFPFFFYLAGLCYKQNTWFRSFIKIVGIGVAVITTFVICWLPFLSDLSLALQVLHRIFPFARGLYEDKVANFWCSLSVLIKIKNILSVQRTVQMCLITTLLVCIPTSIDLFFRPTIKKFLLSLVNCSLAFFLFSFQVHEKSILIAALPVCLLLPTMPLECVWFLLISTFSMYPLLERDGQAISYTALMLLFLILANQFLDLRKQPRATRVLFGLSIAGSVVIHLLALTITPPQRLPDLFVSVRHLPCYSCGLFCWACACLNSQSNAIQTFKRDV